MPKQQSEVTRLIDEVIREMMPGGAYSVSDIVEEVIARDTGALDVEAGRWKQESVSKRVRNHLRRDSGWADDHQMLLPNTIVDIPLPSAISVLNTVEVIEDGELVEVLEPQWRMTWDATLDELRRNRDMKQRSAQADAAKVREMSIWIAYFEEHAPEGMDYVPVRELLALIGESSGSKL